MKMLVRIIHEAKETNKNIIQIMMPASKEKAITFKSF
jgi:hypothetical protein